MPEIRPPELPVVREHVGARPRVAGHGERQRLLLPDVREGIVAEDGDAFAGSDGQELRDREIVVAAVLCGADDEADVAGVVYGLLVGQGAVGDDVGGVPDEVGRPLAAAAAAERVRGAAVGVADEEKAGWIGSQDEGDEASREAQFRYGRRYGELGEIRRRGERQGEVLPTQIDAGHLRNTGQYGPLLRRRRRRRRRQLCLHLPGRSDSGGGHWGEVIELGFHNFGGRFDSRGEEMHILARSNPLLSQPPLHSSPSARRRVRACGRLNLALAVELIGCRSIVRWFIRQMMKTPCKFFFS